MSVHHSLYETLGVSPEYKHVAGAALVATVLSLMGIAVKLKLKNIDDHVIPEGRVNLLNISASIVGAWRGLLNGMIGHGAEVYIPLVGTTFLFILLNNLSGLIPGLPPATENINTNIALGLVTFVAYQYLGIKEHGFHYIQQFTGGLPPKGYSVLLTLFLTAIAGLLLVIETIGHLFRPLSLSLRLWGNINGDHTLVNVMLGLVPLGVPILAMALGVFVCFIQSLVFSLLSAVYIKLAVSHDH